MLQRFHNALVQGSIKRRANEKWKVWKASKADRINLLLSKLELSGRKLSLGRKILSGLLDKEIDVLLNFENQNIDETPFTSTQSMDVSDMYFLADDTPDDSNTYSDCAILAVELANRILHAIISKNNPALTAHCLLFLFGRSIYSSEQDIATAFSCTRSLVSNRCIELRKMFNINHTSYGRNNNSISSQSAKRFNDSIEEFSKLDGF